MHLCKDKKLRKKTEKMPFDVRSKSFVIALSTLLIAVAGCTQNISPAKSPEYTDVSEDVAPSSPEITAEADRADQADEPEISTVIILDRKYDAGSEELDLSDMKPEDTYFVGKAISQMPNLKCVNLMSEESSALSVADVAFLKNSAPNVHFIYELDIYDTHISTEDKEVSFVKKNIGNDGEKNIRRLLLILDKCEYFLVDDCRIDDEIMAQIRDDHPESKVVWRIHVGRKSALTDDPIIRMTHGINDSMTGPLKYCTEVVYMDLGHDGGISDISFIENMPELECLILSDARVTDLTPLTGCHKLKWLELISCGRIKNLQVIADMDSIKYLNISNARIKDISGIWDMDLDRFSCIGNGIPEETIDRYKEEHPDCMCAFSGNPYGYAWRYDDYGYHYFSYYARMREVFRYDKGSPGGFKWPEDE